MKSIKKRISFNIAPVSEATKFSFTIKPGDFFRNNNYQLPTFCHEWNVGYDFDTFWYKYIPYNDYKRFNDLDYSTYINKIKQNMKPEDDKIKTSQVTAISKTKNNISYDYGYGYSLPQSNVNEYLSLSNSNNTNCFESYLSGKEYDDTYDIYISLKNLNNSNKNNAANANDYIIVTLTTWKKRINNISYIIEDIMNNTLLPDKICINLSIKDFPEKEQNFPDSLISILKKYNDMVEINWLQNNTKVWKKLIPTLCKYPDAVVISIDDDWRYPNDIVETLYNDYCKYDKKYPISGNKIKMFNIKCHCGSGSLTTYNLLNSKGQFNTLSEECIKAGSDDIFYTYCAHINGNDYKQASKLFFTNMKAFQANDAYSDGATSKVDITKTYNIAKQNYENNIIGNGMPLI